MARRRQSSDIISLFPFLSILACTIGTLTMMIVCAVLASAAKPSAEDEAEAVAAEQRVQEFKQLQEQRLADQQEIEKLRQLIAEAEALRVKLKQERAALVRLQEEQAKQENLTAEIAKLLAQAEALKARIAELETTLTKVEEEIKKLLEEIKKRKQPPPPAEVQIKPSGSAGDLVPTFIECTPRGLVVYDGNEPLRVAAAEITTDQRLYSLLQRVGDSRDGTLIFLVRSDGIGTYSRAVALARAERVRNGKLPVPGQGQLDLSLFQQSRK